jgi:hypothetical protein
VPVVVTLLVLLAAGAAGWVVWRRQQQGAGDLHAAATHGKQSLKQGNTNTVLNPMSAVPRSAARAKGGASAQQLKPADGFRRKGSVYAGFGEEPPVDEATYGDGPPPARSASYAEVSALADGGGGYDTVPAGQYDTAPAGQYDTVPAGQYDTAPAGQYDTAPAGQHNSPPTRATRAVAAVENTYDMQAPGTHGLPFCLLSAAIFRSLFAREWN